MKRLIIGCLLVSLLLACVPTPDHEYVINKSDPDRDDRLLVTSAPVDVSETRVLLSERIGAPERWTEEPFTKTVPYDTLTVIVDAAVHVPETERVGVYVATFDVPFSEAQQKALIRKFLGDSENPTTVDKNGRSFRKWEIEEEILLRQKELERASTFDDPEMRSVLTEQANEQIRQSMESYRDAPEDWIHTPWNGVCISGRGESAGQLYLYAPTDQPAHYKTLLLWAYGIRYQDESLCLSENLDIYSTVLNPRSAVQGMPQTDEERAAAELAKNEANALGVGTFSVKAVANGKETHIPLSSLAPDGGTVVYLWLTVDGLPIYNLSTWHGNDNLPKDEPSEDANYNGYLPEQTVASFGIRDGKLAYLEISGLQTIQFCVNENAQLLPFSEIERIFCQQIGYRYYTGDDENPNSGNGETIHITDAYLSMMRVRKKDTPDEFYLLPVWDFVGYTEYDASPFSDEELEQQKIDYQSMTFLTVNAIDGTIIDRNLGY